MLSRVIRSQVGSPLVRSARNHYYLAPDGHPGANLPFNVFKTKTFVGRLSLLAKFTVYVSVPTWIPWIAMRFHCKKASGM